MAEAATGQETTQKFRVHINGPIEDVWHEITRTDRAIPAFFNTKMDCRDFATGAKLAMRTTDGKYTGVVGEILEFDPPHRFVHTFKFTNFDDPYLHGRVRSRGSRRRDGLYVDDHGPSDRHQDREADGLRRQDDCEHAEERCGNRTTRSGNAIPVRDFQADAAVLTEKVSEFKLADLMAGGS